MLIESKVEIIHIFYILASTVKVVLNLLNKNVYTTY
jgi:hypothetical protein